MSLRPIESHAFDINSTINFSLSEDHSSNKTVDVNCKSSHAKNFVRSFSLELADRKHRNPCQSKLGFITIHNKNEILNFTQFTLQTGKGQRFLLKPKITTTDESLRSVSAKQ